MSRNWRWIQQASIKVAVSRTGRLEVPVRFTEDTAGQWYSDSGDRFQGVSKHVFFITKLIDEILAILITVSTFLFTVVCNRRWVFCPYKSPLIIFSYKCACILFFTVNTSKLSPHVSTQQCFREHSDIITSVLQMFAHQWDRVYSPNRMQ